MKINEKKLMKDLIEISKFGMLKNGGITRIALTNEESKARRYLIKRMQEIGLEVRIDAFGNILGKRKGKHALSSVMIGSHVDSVPSGGKYDGVVGIIGALEVIRVLNEENIDTERPIEVIVFSSEEASRFGTATLGSGGMVGDITLDDYKNFKDEDGISYYEALVSAGVEVEKYHKDQIRKGDVYAFIEMHIEQGPVLEANNCSVGIVTCITGATRIKVTIEGRADHSGSTPMGMRKDALAAASELVLGVENIAENEAGETTVGTVGYMIVEPGAMNVVPGKVDLGIDLRDINIEDKKAAFEKIKQLINDIVKKRSVEIHYDVLVNENPVVLSDKVINKISNISKEIGASYMRLPSGAGHDCRNMSFVTEAGMIFIPSINGISHNVKEFSRFEDIVKGTEVLLKSTIEFAQEV